MHECTKCTPDKLFLGRDLRCPLSVRWDLCPEGTDVTGEVNQSFWTQSYENLKKPRSKVALSYDANRKPQQYSVGDTVVYCLHMVSSKAHNISAKLAMRWSRPVLIAKVVGPNSVLLSNPDTGGCCEKSSL